MGMTRILSFKAWTGEHYVGLAELLTSLGSAVEGHHWRVTVEEWIASSRGEAIADLVADSLVSTEHLIDLFGVDAQLIDGELVGYPEGSSTADIRIRASDSSHWDVQSDKPEVLETILRIHPTAQDLTEW
ncbi:hypothetical protein ACFXJ8_12100 [Nonomuraea sp. NPDC059194]|uniref:hypothetical protein n=1 Tax=Nonomuraea sp. NPDC059194 TaxID=3346764 RepID=UPI00367552CA